MDGVGYFSSGVDNFCFEVMGTEGKEDIVPKGQHAIVVVFGHFNHHRIVGLVGLYCFPVGLIVLIVGLIVLKVGWIVLKVGLFVLFVYSIVCE